METKVLECQFCSKLFSEDDVKRMLFFPESSGCWNCYVILSKEPIRKSCFGKKSIVDTHGKVVPQGHAYDPTAVQCRADVGFCPHRFICPKFISGEIMSERTAVKEAYPMIPFKQKDSIIGEAFSLCLKGTTKSNLHKLVTNHGGDAVRILRIFRKGVINDTYWKLDEIGEYLKIYLLPETSI